MQGGPRGPKNGAMGRGPTGPWLRFVWPILLLAFAGSFNEHSWSIDRPAEKNLPSLYFQIPSQPLATALEAYARESGIEVLYESRIVSALQSSSVDGTFTPDAALEMLLGGTELQIHYARSNAITLSLPKDETRLPPASPLESADLSLDTLQVKGGSGRADDGNLREFSEAIQFDLEKALRRNTQTRSGNYRVAVNLWLDSARTIRNVSLASSTGDAARDASIPGVLQGLALSRPPPTNTPQPIKVVITVRSL